MHWRERKRDYHTAKYVLKIFFWFNNFSKTKKEIQKLFQLLMNIKSFHYTPQIRQLPEDKALRFYPEFGNGNYGIWQTWHMANRTWACLTRIWLMGLPMGGQAQESTEQEITKVPGSLIRSQGQQLQWKLLQWPLHQYKLGDTVMATLGFNLLSTLTGQGFMVALSFSQQSILH